MRANDLYRDEVEANDLYQVDAGANDLYRDDLLVQACESREGGDVVRVVLQRLPEVHVFRVASRMPNPIP